MKPGNRLEKAMVLTPTVLNTGRCERNNDIDPLSFRKGVRFLEYKLPNTMDIYELNNEKLILKRRD